MTMTAISAPSLLCVLQFLGPKFKREMVKSYMLHEESVKTGSSTSKSLVERVWQALSGVSHPETVKGPVKL